MHPGHVGAFSGNISFNITTVPGIKNMIFGGDGIFLAALTGPGRVWLQTLPLSNLAHQLQRYMPGSRGEGSRGVGNIGAAAVIGGLASSIFDNNR